MEGAVLSYVLLAICLTMKAEPVISSPQDNESQYPDPVALFSRGKPVREGAILLLQDSMKQGDTLLKERLEGSYTNLKELLREGDTQLKERTVEGLDRVKEQLKEGDNRLKEELDGDTAWLKEKIVKGLSQVQEQLAEQEANCKKELSEQKEAFEELRSSVKQWTQSSSIQDLKQQASDFKAELNSTQHQLQMTKSQLQDNQQTLQSTQKTLQSNQETLQSTQETLQSTQETLQSTQADLRITQQKLKSTEETLQETRELINAESQASLALKTQLQQVQVEIENVQSGHHLDVLGAMEIGSTFTRWGRTTCPDNTSLVYSGVAGGQWWEHTGGGSNYLCLGMEPQLDNMTLPVYVNYVYGAEYEHVPGHHDQDVVCSVCRAPQATTLMIPATLTCPPGWTTQYKGHLMSGYYTHKGRTEYVCLDEIRENRDSGEGSENGVLFYHVAAACGSLPCPPYKNKKIITCVICSM